MTYISGGVDTAAVGGTFDISNLDRLGFSEVGSILHLLSQASMVLASASLLFYTFSLFMGLIYEDSLH